MWEGEQRKERGREKKEKGKREKKICVHFISILSTVICAQFSSVIVLSHVQFFGTPWTVARQASPPMEFSRQEYRRGLPFPSSSDLSNPGIEPEDLASPALAGRFFTTIATWEAQKLSTVLVSKTSVHTLPLKPQWSLYLAECIAFSLNGKTKSP